MKQRTTMAISKTSTLMVALVTGFISLLLQTLALSTDFWTCSTFTGPAKSVEEYYTINRTIMVERPRGLIKNRGLWRMCHFIHTIDNSTVQAVAKPDGTTVTTPVMPVKDKKCKFVSVRLLYSVCHNP